MAVQHLAPVQRHARQRETFEEAMARLAVEAKRAGIQVRHYGNEWYATSQSDPHILHRVTLSSCDCRGYQKWQRCRHLARLLDITGNLPGVDLPIGVRPRAAVTCLRCWGAGMVGEEDRWCGQCPECHGTGTVEPKPAA